MAARDGEHVDAGEWKSVNLSPCLAIRFRFGVLFAFSPGLLASRSSQPISSASMMMKLGLFLGFSTLAPCWDTVQSSSPHSSIPDRTKRVKASAILGQTEMSVSMPLHTDHMSRCSDKVCSPEDNGVGGFGSTNKQICIIYFVVRSLNDSNFFTNSPLASLKNHRFAQIMFFLCFSIVYVKKVNS